MSECRFSPESRRDLEEIHDYVAAGSADAALRLVDRLEAKCAFLADNPSAAEACEFLAPRLRFSTLGNYVIFYRPIDEGIEVARVLHGAREWRRMF